MTKATIFIVDDDAAIRESLTWLLEIVDYPVKTFSSAQEFLDVCNPDIHGCLILDVRLPGMSGLQLQKKMKADGIYLPVIIISGHGDVQMAVKAIQQGALTFLEKPFRDQELLDSIQDALQIDEVNREKKKAHDVVKQRLNTLTPREKEILQRVVDGDSSRVIGENLGISAKTVEVHRTRIIEKLQARNLPDLIQMALSVNES